LEFENFSFHSISLKFLQEKSFAIKWGHLTESGLDDVHFRTATAI
jgi:hypothetical protein